MSQPTVVIEPTDSAFKIIVGHVLNHEPIILYTSCNPMPAGLIKNGLIINHKGFADYLKQALHVEDKKALAKFDIHSAILILPPIGLDIYEDYKSTLVVGSGKVEKFDIANVLSMIQKENISTTSNKTVDIVPLVFYVKQGKTPKLPIGMISDHIGMKALIYSLPDKIVSSFKTVSEIAGLQVIRNTIAPAAIANLLSKDKNTPNAYIFVDIGSTYTTLSLISKTFIYSSSFFNIGGNDLTKHIADSFKISFDEADKLKNRYGYNLRIMSFDPVITNSISPDGIETLYTLNDLKNSIKNFLDNYIYSFNTCLNKMLSNYPEDKKNFPLILGGGGSKLENLIEYFKENYPNKIISRAPLNVLGARDEKYLNLVGALLLNDTYTGSLSDSGTDFESAIEKLKKAKKNEGILN